MGDTLERYCDTASYCHIGELVYAANPPPLVISASLLDVEHAISSLEDESCDESERERELVYMSTVYKERDLP